MPDKFLDEYLIKSITTENVSLSFAQFHWLIQQSPLLEKVDLNNFTIHDTDSLESFKPITLNNLQNTTVKRYKYSSVIYVFQSPVTLLK